MRLKCSEDCSNPYFRAFVDVTEVWDVDEYGHLTDRVHLAGGPEECEPDRAWCDNCGADVYVEEESDGE